MNQKKIGLSQSAEKEKNGHNQNWLKKSGVTDRSVSNWEDGVAADNNLLVLLEHRLYDTTSQEITFDEFHNSLKIISEVALFLQRFEDKQEAVTYLVNETGLSEEECASAYDIYVKSSPSK